MLGYVTSSASLSDYRAAFTTPGALSPVIASMLARLPIAMVGLALLLYVRAETGSIAIAGLLSALSLVGVATGSVTQARLIDRFGPTRPLLTVTAAFGVVIAVTTVAIELNVPQPVLAVLAFTVGLTEPMVGPASRAMWPRLLPAGHLRNAALSYEAISLEVFFILGPGIAGVLTALPWHGTGFVVGGALMVIGTIWFCFTTTIRKWHTNHAAQRSFLGPLVVPGMRTLVLAVLGFGIVIGFIEVAIPESANRAGQPAMSGVLLSLMSVTSVLVGVVYGVHPWPRPMGLRLPFLLAVFGLLTMVLAVPSGLIALTLVLMIAGSAIAPQATAHSAAVELVVPPHLTAEGFGWVITAATAGIAIGQGASGLIAARFGPPASFAVGGAIGFIAAVLLLTRHSTMDTPHPRPAAVTEHDAVKG